MGIPRRFTIAESSHRILNPFTTQQLLEFGDALGLDAGQTMLDLASGKGEALCRWAVRHGISGTGVDINPPFVAAARERAAELGVADRVEFVEGNASGYVAAKPVDVAACFGATWIADGPVGTLELLRRSLKPGGIAVLGDAYWREEPPTDAAIKGAGAEQLDDFPTLPALIDDVQAAGWDVVEMMHATEASWDRYVAAQWLNLRRYIDANADDEIVPELRRELAVAPGLYVRYQRRYLGWGVLALMRR